MMRSLLLQRLRLSGALALVTGACLSLAACGGSGGAGTDRTRIHDFGKVLSGPISVQLGQDGTSAVIRLVTNPATMCAVSYGTTAQLGRIANDPGMGGTAITRHTVTLSGLRPATSYRYRLTATDASGRVFQTPQDLELRTRPVPRGTALGVDLARGAKVVAVSSEWSGDFGAAKAFDGDLSTEWSSAGDGDRASVTIDLGRTSTVTGVANRTREMADGSAITRTYAVTVDGSKRYGPFVAGDRLDAKVAALSASGRRFRFDVVTSTGGNTGAAEIALYAAAPGSGSTVPSR